MKAKITATTDAGCLELVRDEYGDLWRYAGDDMLGNVMVEEICDGASSVAEAETCGRAGVFSYSPYSEDEGTLVVKEDGATFGVNCADEFVVAGGEWTENEA